MLENFPLGRHDDGVDALSGAHGILYGGSGGSITVEHLRLLTASSNRSSGGIFALTDADRLTPYDLDLQM